MIPPEKREILFISSNVGAIFDREEECLSWFAVVNNHLLKYNANIVVLTLQEFGGKSIVSWEVANKFLGEMYKMVMNMYPIFISFVDCDIKSEIYYTALCTIILATEAANQFELFDFKQNNFLSYASGYHVHKLLNTSELSIKIKFPIDFFPHKKWSRKGYMITRLKIFGSEIPIDIINLHLTHDSNFHLSLNNPSLFQQHRTMQLESILKTLDQIKSSSSVLCGDFNFRSSLVNLVKLFDENCIIESVINDNETKIIRNSSTKAIMAKVSSKAFQLDHELLPVNETNCLKYKACDNELEKFGDKLFELPVNFPPTYCFSTGIHPSTYNEYRCPSWCDRILFRGIIVKQLKKAKDIIYESFGKETNIGDHKPISITIPINSILNLDNNSQ